MKKTYHSTQSATAAAKDGNQTRTHSIRRKWFVRAIEGFLFASIFALSAPRVEAQCQRWDVSGQWELRLDDGGNVKVNLQQSTFQQQSANLTGTGERIAPAAGNYTFNKPQKGVISGNITGKFIAILLRVRTDEHRFTGTISPSGKIEGTSTTSSRQGNTWVSSSRMTCGDATPAGTPGPTTTSGQMPPAQSQTHASAAAPTITAHPTSLTIPDGQSHGTVRLTWDGGPDHPYAEVWVKQGGHGKEKFLVEQGKGTRRVTVKRGKTYQFILTDSGQRLATAVVTSRR